MTVKSVRLNKTIRHDLNVFARKNVPEQKGQSEVDTQYKALFKLVKAAVAEKFPIKDMKILDKYDMVHRLQQFKFVNLDTRKMFQVYLNTYDSIPVAGRNVYNLQFEASDELTKLYEKYNLAKTQLQEKKNVISDDYKNFVTGCNTSSQVLEGWPAAIAVLDPFINVASRNLPTTMSPDAIARIKKSNLGAKVAG